MGAPGRKHPTLLVVPTGLLQICQVEREEASRREASHAEELLRDFAGKRLFKVKVELYARNSHPLELHKLVNGNITPFVKREARDIPESDMSLRVVLGDIPSTASRDIK